MAPAIEIAARAGVCFGVERALRLAYEAAESAPGPVHTLGALSIDRGTADMGCLRAAQHALQRGEDVLIFPEGTRIKTDDQPIEIHSGFALMASMGKTDVVPMAVCGWRDITGGGTHGFRPVKCWIRAGERVGFDDAPAGLRRRAKQEWLEQEAMRRVYEIRDALRDEHPGRR